MDQNKAMSTCKKILVTQAKKVAEEIGADGVLILAVHKGSNGGCKIFEGACGTVHMLPEDIYSLADHANRRETQDTKYLS